jgi:hypothetical protein
MIAHAYPFPSPEGQQRPLARIAEIDLEECARQVVHHRKTVVRSTHKVKVKSLAEFCHEYAPLSYVIEGLLREGFLYTMTAKTGAGKTALCIVAALAVATGREDILRRKVVRGRVAYIAVENPDDVRMRFMIAARHFGIDWRSLSDQFVVIDCREKPEDLCAALAEASQAEPFALVIGDTLAALFDGDDMNSNTQGGDFMRRLRPLTQVNGKPAVLIAAHPVKNASEDNLVPYGGGAIVNEVDGNLTLWKGDGGLVTLHHNKLRGLEFKPLIFQIETACSPDVVDKAGQQVPLPIMLPGSEQTAEDKVTAGHDASRKLLTAMLANRNATQRELAKKVGTKSVGSINKRLQSLKREKLVEVTLGKWTVTLKGQKAVRDAG